MRNSQYWILLPIVAAVCTVEVLAQSDNGIHVSLPKLYDSRSLTLMLDDLSQSLKKTSFIDPKALATALGNTQGYNSQDFSQGIAVRGAVGPQAAAVVAGGTGGASAGLAAPSLPAQQTAPTYSPTYGPSGADLLSDQTNLTYQFNNVRMLIERSLTDRVYNKGPRLQAVVGFDVDLEPTGHAVDAAAVVEVTVEVAGCEGLKDCKQAERLSLVAVMPEEGSHNAATLSQKASAFGGAIAAQVFSVGYSAQKRSQVFYLYRDMDTVSFQKPVAEANKVQFGWQFRPVLGRRIVTPGMRHMMAVLALPANDVPGQTTEPKLKIHVKTTWNNYKLKTQTTEGRRGLFKPDVPKHFDYPEAEVSVPSTASVQADLGPSINSVKWVPTDASTGVVIVRGQNFFPGTKINFGSKVYATEADGLVIKSDHELEVAAPLTVAVAGGVLSGRYGAALPLEARDAALPGSFMITSLRVYPEGGDMYQVAIDLLFDKPVSMTDLLNKANPPVVLAKGVPICMPPSYSAKAEPNTAQLTTFIPSSALQGGVSTITVTYPFAGADWSASSPYYVPTVTVTRLGGTDTTRLLIAVTDRTLLLCTNRWTLQLDKDKSFEQDKSLGGALLACLDPKRQLLSLDIATKDLKPYHKFILLPAGGDAGLSPLVGDIPSAAPPPPGPSLDKGQKVSIAQNATKSVTFTGANLDQVTKVLFGKTELSIVSKDAKSIVVMISKDVTATAADIELQLISDGNDPILAALTITAAPTTPKEGK